MHIITLTMGIVFLLAGMILYGRRTKSETGNYSIGGITITPEVIGIIFFILGMILILSFLIAQLEPRFSPPGLEGN